MFERFYDIADFLLPVRIIKRDNVLWIEDRRPTKDMLLSAGGAVILVWLVAQVAYWALSEANMFKFVVPGVAVAGYLIYRVLTRTFREIYIFDKTKDTYWFTRQSVLKKEVIQGSASQFRAAEVLKKTVSNDDGTSYTYHAALLQEPGLLLGTDEMQVLREEDPVYNSHRTEARIVAAIASFLNITNNNTVDTL